MSRLIDADALKEYFFRPYSNEELYSNIDLERIIDEQPTIEPKRKTGKWIKCPNRGWGEIWECNHCGETTVSSIMGEPRYRFCPMCGYEMLNGGEPDESD